MAAVRARDCAWPLSCARAQWCVWRRCADGERSRATPHAPWIPPSPPALRLRDPFACVAGYWKQPLRFPRGSGIFINTGRTLVVKKSELSTRCARLFSIRKFNHYPTELVGSPAPSWLALSAQRSRRERQRWKLPEGAYVDQLAMPQDSQLAMCAQKLGYDTLQFNGNMEIVDARPSCTFPGSGERRMGACPPPGSDLRTGWHAQHRCACADAGSSGVTGQTRPLALVNCLDTPSPAPGEHWGRTAVSEQQPATHDVSQL
jgi:hypothetical protein